MPDKDEEARKLSEILDVVGAKVPGMLAAVRDAVFSEEAGRGLGRAVGAFYKELTAAGVPSEEAVGLAQQYVASLQSALNARGNFGKMAFGGQGCSESEAGGDKGGPSDKTGAGKDED